MNNRSFLFELAQCSSRRFVARRFKRICHPLASEHTLCVKESVHSFVVCCKLRLSKPSNRPVLLIKSVVISAPQRCFTVQLRTR